MGELKDKYYNHILEGESCSKEEEIVFKILSDFTNRRGLSGEWDQIDDDIQEEIIETWIDNTREILNK